MPVRLFMSNRLESLAEDLAGVLSRPLLSPFDAETIVVQSKGMERWVSLELAGRLGILANCRFPFPNAFIHEMFQRVMGDLPDTSLFDPEMLTWRIMKLLPDLLCLPGFESLQDYLGDPPQGLKELQLAGRIAEVFDQYVIYRPDWINRWESGEDNHWQAVLWRALAKDLEGRHRASLARGFMERLRNADPGMFGFPERVNVFGISYLPPFHIEILEHLSRFTEVNFFLLNPCREYWGTIASDRRLRQIARRVETESCSMEDLHLEVGNSLLASMGKMGRDFLERMIEASCEEISRFCDPGEESVLAALQSDIFHLRERGCGEFPETAVSSPDRSLQVHSCHSPMRELEVLYDHLLEMFQDDPGLRPGDILVMVPDIETYAPFIEAVFDGPEKEGMRIPYSIADRAIRRESRDVNTFLAVLELWDERLSAPQVLDVLACPPVRARFGMAENDLEVIHRWVRESGIRWGRDRDSRLRWTTQAFHENTWQSGSERLLLGYAMPGGGKRLFHGILPYDHIEGGDGLLLGSFMAFLEELFGVVSGLETPRTLREWSQYLLGALSRLFLPEDESLEALQELRRLLLELERIQETTGFEEPLEIAAIHWYLSRKLERSVSRGGFIAGGVTCCSMLPMRSVPFKIICLLGMDFNSYPRRPSPPEFDLMARAARPGDRSVRDDDRYLFLEALISARKRLYISYTGQSCLDNTVIPPSVLVSELLDYLAKGFHGPGGDRPYRPVVQHRLQPFSPAYFLGPRSVVGEAAAGSLQEGGGGLLFSYSRRHLEEARYSLQGKKPLPVFLPEPLPPPEEELRTVSVLDLGRFLANPAKFLLNRRLGVYLDEDQAVMEETEPFELSALERYGVGEDLVAAVLEGVDTTELLAAVKAAGRLPHGVPGERLFMQLQAEVKNFAGEAKGFLTGEKLPPVELRCPIGDFMVTGRIEGVYPDHLVRYRFAALKAKDHLRLWVQHLLMNLLQPEGYPRVSLLMGVQDRRWQAFEYRPVQGAEELLGGLLELYWRGLSEPVHFIPKASFDYAKRLLVKGQSPQEALRMAGMVWEGTEYRKGEREEPHMWRCFASSSPVDTEFQRVSEAVFGPLFDCLREVSTHG